MPFSEAKIANAIFKAAVSVGGKDRHVAERLAKEVTKGLKMKYGHETPSIENVQDMVEKILVEFGHARTSKAFILYRDKRSRVRDKIKVRRKVTDKGDTTDILLLVSGGAKDEYLEWDRARIVQALKDEAGLTGDLPYEIANNVERKIIKSGLDQISTSLIRALVDNELFEYGETARLEKQTMLGVPLHDLNSMIFLMSSENANTVANNPEAVNLAIAETIFKKYALQEVFTKDVADAHLKGAIHLHDLGYVIRSYCSSHSLEYLKKYGLDLHNLSTTSSPPKHAQTLTGHLNTFLASMQAYYAGALGLGFVNIMYAPLLVGKTDQEMKQEAQYFIFSCSQNAFSRGSQTLFIDANIHLGVPHYLRDIPAIGPNGKYMWRHENGEVEYLDEAPRDEKHDVIQPKEGRILTYIDFEDEAQRFAKALMDVWRAGDSRGQVFPFPKMNLHIDANTFSDPKQHELFMHSCLIASENGAPYFVFDRDSVGINLSMCCRLVTKITDNYLIKHPESQRFCGFQNVSINLPQAAFRAGKGNVEGCLEEIGKMMDLAMKAHLTKKEFIGKLMEKPGMPLWQVGDMAKDGRPYVELDKATYIIGLVGLNECVKFLQGEELHESDEAYKLGLKVISGMYLKVKQFEKEHKLKVTLEESPAESASFRFAKVDLKEFPLAKDYVKGDLNSQEVYYTNSCHFAPDAQIDILERIEKQARFNTLIESGAITHVFLGEQRPNPEAIAEVVKKTWDNTPSSQITISPEFTICRDCNRISPGFRRGEKENKSRLEAESLRLNGGEKIDGNED
jgi:ribonucleoside-triphosphate reductase